MNSTTKKAQVTTILILLIAIVITSAVILYLVKSSILTLQEENDQPPASVLNTEFLPLPQTGSLLLKEARLCNYVGQKFSCIGETTTFEAGSEIHLVYVVSATNLRTSLLEQHYLIKDGEGTSIVEVAQQVAPTTSSEELQDLQFRDYFILQKDLPPGDYALEITVQNMQSGKKSKIVKKFTVIAPEFANGQVLISDEEYVI